MASCSLYTPRRYPIISRHDLDTILIFQRLGIRVGGTGTHP